MDSQQIPLEDGQGMNLPSMPPRAQRRSGKGKKPPRFINDAGIRLAKILERVEGIDGTSGSRLFGDFLEITEISLMRLGDHCNALLQTGKMEEGDPPEIAKRWQRVVASHRKPQEVFAVFAEAFAFLMEATTDESGNPTYADVLGQAYMMFGSRSGQSAMGQFFTPQGVARAMAEMILSDVDGQVKQRLREAFEKSPEAQVLGLAVSAISEPGQNQEAFRRYILPLLAGHYRPITILDPCVGSGGMLLAAAQVVPPVYTALGLVQYFGTDIDAMCVQMCRINCMLYGLNGWTYIVQKQEGAAAALPARGGIWEVEKAPAEVIEALPEPARSAYQELRANPQNADRTKIRRRVLAGQMGMFGDPDDLPTAD